MFEKLFNKPKENSKVEQHKDTTLGVSSMKIIAKDTLIIPRLAKELKVINKSFKQLVRLEGGQPAESESLKSYNNKYGSMKELHIADRKVKRMKEEQRPADFLVVLFEKFTTVLKLVFLGTLFSGVLLAEKISELIDFSGLYKSITSFFTDITNGVVNFFTSIDWLGEFKNKIGDLIEFISFGMFTKKDAMLIVEGAGNFTSEILHRFGEILVVAAKIVKEHFEKLGRFLAIDLLGVDYEEIDRQKKERSAAVEMSESLKKDNDALDVEVKSLQNKRNTLNEKKYKREKDAREQKIKQQEEEAKKKETVGDKLKKIFTPKEAVVEEKPVNISTGASGFGLTAPSVTPTPAPAPVKPAPAPTPAAPTPAPAAPKPADKKEKAPAKAGTVDASPKLDTPTPTKFEAASEITLGAISSKSGKKAYVNEQVAPRFQKLIDWFESINYEIKVLGGYNQRKIAGTDKWSTHSYGVAIDINPAKNPMVSPTKSDWTDMPIEETSQMAKKLGLGWGGDWKSKKDAMHFSIAKNEGGDTPLSTIESAGLPTITKNGKQLAQNSSDLELEKREQEKRKNALVINAGTTNNTVIKNQNNVVAAT